MLRWHTSSCSDPAIATNDSRVSCRNCCATYSFNEQSVPQSTHASLNIPGERPLGQLNLSWPPSVLYTSDEKRDGGDETGETVRGRDNTLLSSERCSQNAAHSSIYRPLDAKQFRLICLDSTKSQSDLIHLDLEQHDLDNCPEYEATSYAWAGEDNDDQRSGPIFIGNFYDVAFQTKNCLSMLRYLRPSRGVRLVWIDAICIDQSNTRERDKQVIAMRNIYRNASRVVVYLGPEAVLPSNQQHRRRSRLEQLDAFKEKDIQKIKKFFSHRYFRRVWIIQELLLAKSLCMPLHDYDYHADSTSIQQLDVNWVEATVPWFEHIAGGRKFARHEIGLLLDETWESKATDPRDKLFGVLGLTDTAVYAHKPPGNAKAAKQLDFPLLPDYTLSEQEIFIGLVAYVVIVLDQWHILERAAGLDTAQGYPTWVPDRSESTIWRNPMTAKQDDCDLIRPWYEDMGLCCKEVFTIASGFQDKDIEWRHKTNPHEPELNESWGAKDLRELRAMMTVGNAANEQVSIHSSTATLSIKLICVIQLSSKPRQVAELGSFRMFEFIMAQHSLLICTALIELDKILDQTPTWIFLRDIDDGTGPTVFFLRGTHREGEQLTYKLIYCCRCWDLLIFRRPQRTESSVTTRVTAQRPNMTHRRSTLNFRHAVMKMEHSNDCYDIPFYGRKASWGKPLPYETLYAATSIINVDAVTGRKLLLGFPAENLRVKDVLPLLQLLVDSDPERPINYRQLGERYMSLVNCLSSVTCSMRSPCLKEDASTKEDASWPKAKPPEDHGNIYLTIDATTWATYRDLWRKNAEYGTAQGDVLVNQKRSRCPGSSDEDYTWMGWSRLGIYSYGRMVENDCYVDEQATVYLCIPLHEIAQYMQKQELAKQFNYLRKFRSMTGQDETTMVLSTGDYYRNIILHPWPDDWSEEPGLIGKPCRIQIV